MVESFQTAEERIKNNNVRLIRFIHSVTLEIAMLKSHSSKLVEQLPHREMLGKTDKCTLK